MDSASFKSLLNPNATSIAGRRDQAFPVFTDAEIARMRRFGELRRVAHIESAGSGPVLVGDMRSSSMVRLENFLQRNGQPHHSVKPEDDAAASTLFAHYGAGPDDVVVVCPNGTTLLSPSEEALGV